MRGERFVLSLREIRPSDFYLISSWRKDGIPETRIRFKILLLLSLGEFRAFLKNASAKEAMSLLKWLQEELLDGQLMEPKNWLELAYVLSKERWNSSLDWLESQPISKVLAMYDVSLDCYEKQKAAMKRK